MYLNFYSSTFHKDAYFWSQIFSFIISKRFPLIHSEIIFAKQFVLTNTIGKFPTVWISFYEPKVNKRNFHRRIHDSPQSISLSKENDVDCASISFVQFHQPLDFSQQPQSLLTGEIPYKIRTNLDDAEYAHFPLCFWNAAGRNSPTKTGSQFLLWTLERISNKNHIVSCRKSCLTECVFQGERNSNINEEWTDGNMEEKQFGFDTRFPHHCVTSSRMIKTYACRYGAAQVDFCISKSSCLAASWWRHRRWWGIVLVWSMYFMVRYVIYVFNFT